MQKKSDFDFLSLAALWSIFARSCSYTTQPFCEYIALFMWVEKAACSETLIRDKGLNRGTCAFDGCFTKRVGRSMTEQQNTWCFLNSKVSGRQSRILARLLEFNF